MVIVIITPGAKSHTIEEIPYYRRNPLLCQVIPYYRRKSLTISGISFLIEGNSSLIVSPGARTCRRSGRIIIIIIIITIIILIIILTMTINTIVVIIIVIITIIISKTNTQY